MTEKCIICLATAKAWTGHVLKDGEPITAGWCNIHKNNSDNFLKMTGPGCFGEWKPEFGLIKK